MMKKTIFIVLGIIAVGVLVFGSYHYGKQIGATEQQKKDVENYQNNEKEDRTQNISQSIDKLKTKKAKMELVKSELEKQIKASDSQKKKASLKRTKSQIENVEDDLDELESLKNKKEHLSNENK